MQGDLVCPHMEFEPPHCHKAAAERRQMWNALLKTADCVFTDLTQTCPHTA
jgi:hypothetical protein